MKDSNITELSLENQEQKVTKEEEITVEDRTTRIHSDHLENTEDDDEFGDFENVQEESMHYKEESLMVKEDIHVSFVSNVSKVFQKVFKTNSSSSSIGMVKEETKEMETAEVACISLEMTMNQCTNDPQERMINSNSQEIDHSPRYYAQQLFDYTSNRRIPSNVYLDNRSNLSTISSLLLDKNQTISLDHDGMNESVIDAKESVVDSKESVVDTKESVVDTKESVMETDVFAIFDHSFSSVQSNDMLETEECISKDCNHHNVTNESDDDWNDFQEPVKPDAKCSDLTNEKNVSIFVGDGVDDIETPIVPTPDSDLKQDIGNLVAGSFNQNFQNTCMEHIIDMEELKVTCIDEHPSGEDNFGEFIETQQPLEDTHPFNPTDDSSVISELVIEESSSPVPQPLHDNCEDIELNNNMNDMKTITSATITDAFSDLLS